MDKDLPKRARDLLQGLTLRPGEKLPDLVKAPAKRKTQAKRKAKPRKRGE